MTETGAARMMVKTASRCRPVDCNRAGTRRWCDGARQCALEEDLEGGPRRQCAIVRPVATGPVTFIPQEVEGAELQPEASSGGEQIEEMRAAAVVVMFPSWAAGERGQSRLALRSGQPASTPTRALCPRRSLLRGSLPPAHPRIVRPRSVEALDFVAVGV